MEGSASPAAGPSEPPSLAAPKIMSRSLRTLLEFPKKLVVSLTSCGGRKGRKRRRCSGTEAVLQQRNAKTHREDEVKTKKKRKKTVALSSATPRRSVSPAPSRAHVDVFFVWEEDFFFAGGVGGPRSGSTVAARRLSQKPIMAFQSPTKKRKLALAGEAQTPRIPSPRGRLSKSATVVADAHVPKAATKRGSRHPNSTKNTTQTRRENCLHPKLVEECIASERGDSLDGRWLR